MKSAQSLRPNPRASTSALQESVPPQPKPLTSVLEEGKSLSIPPANSSQFPSLLEEEFGPLASNDDHSMLLHTPEAVDPVDLPTNDTSDDDNASAKPITIDPIHLPPLDDEISDEGMDEDRDITRSAPVSRQDQIPSCVPVDPVDPPTSDASDGDDASVKYITIDPIHLPPLDDEVSDESMDEDRDIAISVPTSRQDQSPASRVVDAHGAVKKPDLQGFTFTVKFVASISYLLVGVFTCVMVLKLVLSDEIDLDKISLQELKYLRRIAKEYIH
ncbi:hypothetical protein ONZ45_g7566 [Pleurotus djamor]|nr:hypothetical protein ONZ45_g7566 [Pleurotus djamor]